jgi:flagellin-like protein
MKFTHRRKAVSPIIATLLLIAIAVAAGIIVYVYVNSLAGNLTAGGGGQESQQIQLQSYSFNPVGTAGFTSSGTSGAGQTVDVFLENTGSSSVVISAVYVDGNQLTEWGSTAGVGPSTYSKYLEVPASGQSCFALVPSTGFTATAVTSTQTTANGAAAVCTGTAGTCVVTNTFCIGTGASGQAETGGLSTSALAPQSTAQLIIGLNYANAATAGTSHTIKIVTATGGQAVFTVTAGRTG